MKQLEQAIKILQKGGVVVYPTDTAYGLAVDATNAEAVKKLYQLKGRSFHKPIHVIFPRQSDIRRFVRMSPISRKLMKKFWPGPLTIVLPLIARDKSWQMLSAGTKSLGVRLPKHDLCIQLTKFLDRPITTTSANVSGQAPAYSMAEVRKQFRNVKFQPDYYLDGGKLKKTQPSTVVSLIKDVKILRAGPITEKQIQNVLLRAPR